MITIPKNTAEYRNDQIENVIKERMEYPHKDNIALRITYADRRTNYLNITLEELMMIRNILTKGQDNE